MLVVEVIRDHLFSTYANKYLFIYKYLFSTYANKN